MHLDVRDIAAFYGSPLGHAVTRSVRRHVRAIWPDLSGCRVAGLGFPQPYLLPFRQEAERILCLMPAHQGCQRWPANGGSLVSLVEEGHLPLPDASIDRFLLAHALETSEMIRMLLRELWRVLADDGQLLLVVPNRLSLWARLERTPFGHGHPFTGGQVRRMLEANMFAVEAHQPALYMPPFSLRPFIASGSAWEEVGSRLWPQFAGVHLVLATKELYGGLPSPRRAFRLVPGLAPGLRGAGAERMREAQAEESRKTPSSPRMLANRSPGVKARGRRVPSGSARIV